MKKTSQIEDSLKILSVLILFLIFFLLLSVYTIFNPVERLQFPGFWWYSLGLVCVAFSVTRVYFESFDLGERSVFENPEEYYAYKYSGANLKIRVENFCAEQTYLYGKNWKKMLKINQRDSETFKTFEKEALCSMLDKIYTLYKMCLVNSKDEEHNFVRSLFIEVLKKEIPVGSLDRLIVNAGRPKIAKEFNMI